MAASTSSMVTGMPRSTRLVTPCSRHAAGHDAGKVREVRLDVQADAVEGHPAPDPDADGGDLVLRGLALVGPAHPHPDPVLPALAADVEGIEGGDEPGLQGRHVAAQVRRAAVQVQHHVGHALAGAVIGVLPSPPRPMDRETVGLDEVRLLGRGSRRVERRVLHEPDQLPRLPGSDRLGAGLHEGDGLLIADRLVRDRPFDRLGAGLRMEMNGQAVSQVRHRFTLSLRDAERRRSAPRRGAVGSHAPGNFWLI